MIDMKMMNLPVEKKEKEGWWKVHGWSVGIFTKGQENKKAAHRWDYVVCL